MARRATALRASSTTARKRATKTTPAASTGAVRPAEPDRPVLAIVGGRGSHMKRAGQPPTDEEIRLTRARGDFLTHLRSGVTLRGSAKLAGIDYSTVLGWRRAEPAFEAQVQEAVLDGIASLEDTIRKAAISDWRAVDRLLQVRDPERWAPKREGTEVNVNVDVSKLNEADVKRKVQELEAKLLGRVVTVDEPLPGLTVDGKATEVEGDEGAGVKD